MEENNINLEATPEMLRELGKTYAFGKDCTPEQRKYGLNLMIEAQKKGDPEAMYLVARLLMDNILKATDDNPTELALRLMATSANHGHIQARAFLNAYCEQQYAEAFDEKQSKASADGLVDFDGKPIRIKREGVMTPIDAVLERKDNRNVLTLSVNLRFVYVEDMIHVHLFEGAVIRGIKAWQGEYTVFGGQQLSVRVVLTQEERKFDNVIVIPMTKNFSAAVQQLGTSVGTKGSKQRVENIMTNKRSFAVPGITKWSATSRKIIYMQSHNGKFDDYDELMHTAKHEFGHALGLGDLYTDAGFSLPGVDKGTYSELDSYAITDKLYNLVMCDSHGPISNNDIEMVVLAFRENKMQLYQQQKLKGKVSSALGKGN